MSTIRLADLVGSHVVDADGARIGRVVDVVVDPNDDYALLALVVGGVRGWLERLDMTRAVAKRGRLESATRVPWERVDRIDGGTIHLTPE
jgi:sporulation protein YlmC with PRC-barrel domain